jgi:hypothetical protein
VKDRHGSTSETAKGEEREVHSAVVESASAPARTRGQSAQFTALVKHAALELCLQHKIPLPQLGIGMDEWHDA